MKVSELIKENSDKFAGFNEDQVRQLEQRIGDEIDDLPEIISIGPNRDGEGYTAHIRYDGTNNKANRGTATFSCQTYGSNQGISDFVLTNMTGTNFVKRPSL